MLVLSLLSLHGCTPQDAEVKGEYFVWLAANSSQTVDQGLVNLDGATHIECRRASSPPTQWPLDVSFRGCPFRVKGRVSLDPPRDKGETSARVNSAATCKEDGEESGASYSRSAAPQAGIETTDFTDFHGLAPVHSRPRLRTRTIRENP